MKKIPQLFAFIALLGLALSAVAAPAKEAAKEVTLKGTLKCAKCSMNESEKCQTVLVSKEGGKDVKYAVAGPKAPKHGEVCKTDKENVSLIGVVSEKEVKRTITVTKGE